MRPCFCKVNITITVILHLMSYLIPLYLVIRARPCVTTRTSWVPCTWKILLVRVKKLQFLSSGSKVSHRPRAKSRSRSLERFRSDGHSSSRYPCLQVRLGRDRLEVELRNKNLIYFCRARKQIAKCLQNHLLSCNA